MRVIIVIFICVLGPLSFGQEETTRWFFPQKHGNKKWGFHCVLDVPRPVSKHNPIKLIGLRTGADYKGIHRFGGGFYLMKNNQIFDQVGIPFDDANDSANVQFDTYFFSMYYERVAFRSPRWEIALPVYGTLGGARGWYMDSTQTYQEFLRAPVVGFGGHVQVKFYVFKWLAPKVGFGYRFSFTNSEQFETSFNRPFYMYGLSIVLGELWKQCCGPERKTLRTNDE